MGYPLRRLTLTMLRIPILRGARTGTLKKAAATFELDKKWAATNACVKLERAKAREAQLTLTDSRSWYSESKEATPLDTRTLARLEQRKLARAKERSELARLTDLPKAST